MELIDKIRKNTYFNNLANTKSILLELLNRITANTSNIQQVQSNTAGIIETVENTTSLLASSIPYKEFHFVALGQGIQPTLVLVDTFDITPVFTSGTSGTTRITSIGAFPDLTKVFIDNGSSIAKPNLSFTPTADYINLNTALDTIVSIKVYN
mgnify:CR=1 FL=1